MKGPEAGADLQEIDEGNRRDYELEEDRKYTLPGTTHQRRILVFRKTGSRIRRSHHIFKNSEETMGTPITSADNRTFRELKKLGSPAGIKKAGSIILSGKKVVAEALADERIKKHQIIIFDGYGETDEVMNARFREYAASANLLILKKGLYGELDIFNTDGPLLVTETPETAEWTGPEKPGCYLLVPFQDPQNVGTVIRSAAGFGVSGIILLRESSTPFHPRAVRASAGSVFNAPLFRGPSLQELSAGSLSGIPVIPLDRNGKDITGFTFPETFYLLPGLEGPGIPEEMKKTAVSIPLSESIESLNAAIAATIAMYEWKRQQN
jgi:16S rRNA (guanine527-N7)-methyltransferase